MTFENPNAELRAIVDGIAAELYSPESAAHLPAWYGVLAGIRATPGWRCFHCGDYFTDRAAARLHFGPEIDSAPACLIKGSEGGLLKAFSTAEQAATDYMVKLHEEDGQLIRAFRDQASRVRAAVQSAEETGFQRGVDQCFDPIRALLEKHAALPNEPEGTGGAFRAAVRELIEGKSA